MRRRGSGQRKDNVLLFICGNGIGPGTGLVGDLRATSAALRNWFGLLETLTNRKGAEIGLDLGVLERF